MTDEVAGEVIAENTVIADTNSEETQSEAVAEGSNPDAVADKNTDDAPKKKGGYKRKIERLESQNAELTQRLAEMAKQKPTRDDFETDGEFIESLSDYKVEEKLLSKEISQTTREYSQELAQEQARSFVEAGKQIYPDFEQVLSEYDGITVNPLINEAIGKSSDGLDLAYYLAKNLEDLALLDGIKNQFLFDKALEKIRGKFKVGKVQVKTTNAPPPINPVSPRITTSTRPEDNTHDFEAYKKSRGYK